MNVKQVCEKFHISQSYLKKNFNKAQQSILKKHGILLEKSGRGAAAVYQIVEDNSRAISLYNEDKKTVMLNHSSIKQLSLNMEFVVFLGIIMTPFEVFRGSYNEFLRYVEIDVNPDNRKELKRILELLHEKQYIHYAVDKTNDEYFFAGIYKAVEDQLTLGIDMVKTCKKLQVQNKKKSWVPLLKTWLGIKYLYVQKMQPYTQKDLSLLTGLNLYQIKECSKILQRDKVFRSDKAFADYYVCLGKVTTLNGIHQGNEL